MPATARAQGRGPGPRLQNDQLLLPGAAALHTPPRLPTLYPPMPKRPADICLPFGKAVGFGHLGIQRIAVFVFGREQRIQRQA